MQPLDYLHDKFNLCLTQPSPIEIPNVGREILATIFNELGYKVGAEIGVFKGEFASIILRGNPEMEYFGVDMWEDYENWKNEVDSNGLNLYMAEAKKRTEKYNVRFFKESSMKALWHFKDESLDWVYIDANHDLPYVMEDIVCWQRKVRSGGIVAGHDYMHSPRGRGGMFYVKKSVDWYVEIAQLKPWFLIGRDAKIPGEIPRYKSFLVLGEVLMRVFLAVSFPSFGVSRVAVQLEKYLPPDFEITNDPTSADLTVLHVVGRHDHNLIRAQRCLELGHKYAVIQYALKSTRKPNPKDWLDLWDRSKVVWSYYDLKAFVPEMYHAPLGVESEIFYKEKDIEEKYLLGTNANGSCYQAECIGESRIAVFRVGGRMLHVGEPFGSDPSVDSFKNVSDDEMRKFYNQCRWYSALRRKDGFELVAAEALLCGTRPILFDTPDYRQWFDGIAEFIPEASVGDTVRSLIKILKGEERPVADVEILDVKKRFNWEAIASEFWERCR